MATSGEFSLNMTMDELIEEAYDHLQIGQEGETLTGNFYNRARRTLNLMLKAWEGQGIHLWTMKEGTLFLRKGQSAYDLRSPTTHVANTYYTTTSLGAVAGSTVVPIASNVGMENGNPIGFVDTDNDLHWYEIASFTASDVTLTSPLLADIPDGAVCYHYPDNFEPVARVLSVRRKESTTYEVPIDLCSREAYMSLPNKDVQGYPVQAYYSREEPQGIMYLWNAPFTCVPVIPFTYERKLQIVTEATQTFDFPDYWLEAITFNLAYHLIPKFGCAPARAAQIEALANQTLSAALGFDTDLYPITINLTQQ